MTQPAIRVEGLWKEYVIGGSSNFGLTFRESVMEAVKAPLRRLAGRGSDVDNEERFWALKDVSFEVHPGEVVGIIGRNGAGKSTLLKVLSRITAPTKGRIEIRGRVASLLEVGTGFHPELTGRENIRLNGAILGMSGAEISRKFDEIVAFAGVGKFIDTPVKRYSSGMQVRLAFAVAAHLDPEILIVDEVLAVGDAEFQKKCMGKMGEIAGKGGRTVLFVSHNMAAVETLCPRSILLSTGQIQQMGTTNAVLNTYFHMIGGDARDGRSTISIGDSLTVEDIILPRTIRSGDSFSVDISLKSEKSGTIRDCALVIESSKGVRVAIADMRSCVSLPVKIDDGSIHISVDIDQLCLVEGDYAVGLFIVTDDFHDNIDDLATLRIAPTPPRGSALRYPPEVRGFCEIDYSGWISVKGRAD